MLNFMLENVNIILALLVLGVFMAMMFNDQMSAFKIHQFLNTFTNYLSRYELTPFQLKVLSHIGLQNKLNGSQPNLTITKISKDLNMAFSTVQQCIKKLAEGYSYKSARTNESITQEGCELVKHEKPNGGRKGVISISIKGKRFLEDIGNIIDDYSPN